MRKLGLLTLALMTLLACETEKSDTAVPAGTPVGSSTGATTGSTTGAGTGTGAATGTGTGTGSGTGSTSGALAGTWHIGQMQSATLTQNHGVDLVSLLEIAPYTTGPAAFTAHVMPMAGGVPFFARQREDLSWEDDGNGKIVLTSSDVQVFDLTTSAAGATLVWDQADPRNVIGSTTSEPAERIELIPAQLPTVDGDYDGVSFEDVSSGTTVLLDSCIAVGPSQWVKAHLDLTIEANGLAAIHSEDGVYGEDTCTTPSQINIYDAAGFWFEEAGVAKVWLFDQDYNGTLDVMTVSLTGSTLSLTRTDCAPQPGCLSEGFSTAEFALQP